MEYTTIRGINKSVSRLGLGCWQLGGHGWGTVDPKKTAQAVIKALKSEITFFDTAPIYGLGESERSLGKLIMDQRKKVILATKVGLKWEVENGFIKTNDLSPGRIQVEIENSLERLNTDYIDLYQVHWPDRNTSIMNTMNALNRLKDDGLIKAIGVCNFHLDQLIEATQYADIVSVQIPFNIIDRSYENIFNYCINNKISIISYSPLAKGLLAGRFDNIITFPSNDHRSVHPYFSPEEFKKNLKIANKVTQLANKLGITPAQCSLLWVLNQPGITAAIFGAISCAQVEENTSFNYSNVNSSKIEIITTELS